MLGVEPMFCVKKFKFSLDIALYNLFFSLQKEKIAKEVQNPRNLVASHPEIKETFLGE